MMVAIPTLETERLILRGWHEGDLEPLATFYADDPTATYVGGPKTREDSWRQLAMMIGHWQMRGYGVFALEPKTGGPVVGWCGPWSPLGFPEMEMGYALFSTPIRGKGFITEAARAVLGYVFGTMGRSTLVSYIHKTNSPSRAVAERLGAKLDGTTELRGHPVSVWRYPAPTHPSISHSHL